MTSFYSILLSLHSWTRWLVLISFLITLFIVFKDKFQFNSLQESTKKFLKIAMILGDIQFTLGITLLFYSPITIAASENMKAAMKVKDLRFFIAEHPFSMILFWIFLHVAVVIAKKDRPEPKKINLILGFYVLALLCLMGGMPWFRPLYRFF
ncbi:MAG: hypothetical protein SFU98_12490 [Leptospiraceae bacterium]|nr:hypothetical protein [Leptospiraceae bacterium]